MNTSESDKTMLHEILNQPNAWEATIDVVEARADSIR